MDKKKKKNYVAKQQKYYQWHLVTFLYFGIILLYLPYQFSVPFA